MKATIDIPEDLYRRVKAQSALQARTVREVTVELYRAWVEGAPATDSLAPTVDPIAHPAWFGGAKSYAEKIRKHDMASMRVSILRGRSHTEGQT